MKYSIEISKQAKKFIAKQQPRQQERLIEAIYRLPFEGDIKRMVGGEPYDYRLRVGDYRILFERHDDRLVVVVINVGNRGDVYK